MIVSTLQELPLISSAFRFKGNLASKPKILNLSTLSWPKSLPVAAMLRDKQLECFWEGSAIVANAQGNVLHQIGDSVKTLIITRSSIKPIHAVLLAEWMQKNNVPLTSIKPEEWILLAASHSGTDKNRRHLSNLLKRFDITVEALVCGQHPPLNKEAFETAMRENRKPDNLDHQCAGHHAGQAIFSKLMGAKLDEYANPKGKVQQYYLGRINALLGEPKAKMILWDGCNIPTTAIPLRDYATLYSKIGEIPAVLNLLEQAPKQYNLISELIGHHGNIDGHLIRVTQGRLLAKCGNDGVLCIFRQRRQHEQPQAETLVLKMWAGSGNQDPIRDRVAIQALADLHWITPKELTELRNLPMFQPIEYTSQGLAKGEEKLRYVTDPLPWKRLNTSI